MITNNNLSHIRKKIDDSGKTLIISDAARPDWDCYATAVAIKIWLESKNKEVCNATFNKIPEKFLIFDDIKKINYYSVEDIDWSYFDLFIGVDTSSFSRMFGAKYRYALEKLPLDKFINIDHHEADEIEFTNPNLTVRDDRLISTAQVFWEYFLKNDGFKITPNIANLLYLAHCSDSNRFMYKSDSGSLNFGQILIDAGADYNYINEILEDLTLNEWIGFRILFDKLEYWYEERTIVLTITHQLEKSITHKFNTTWKDLNLDDAIKTKLYGHVTNFDLGLIIYQRDQSVRISYRVRNSSDIDVIQILESLGMKVGGHKNAGGAEMYMTNDIYKVKNNIRNAILNYLKSHSN